MAEYQTNYDISTGVTRVKHFSRRVIGGAARMKTKTMADALAALNFRVAEQSENSLRAERLTLQPRARGKIFRTPTEISITFHDLSENSVRADFEYALTDAAMFRADHETIEREIDALTALAERSARCEFCENCATPFTSANLNQNFCPACGKQRQPKSPPEVELLQIIAAARRGQRAALAGTIITLSSIAAFFTLLIIGGLPLTVFPVLIFCAAQIGGWLVLASGLRSTQKALAAPSPVFSETALSAPEQLILPEKNQSSEKLNAAPPVTEDSTRNLATPPTADL